MSLSSHQTLPTKKSRWLPYAELMRLDKPIGIYLLLWPTLWALWVAAAGIPSVKNLLIFSLGVIIMRSAGCVINDIADRNFDGHVKRTAARPLARGALSVAQAWILFGSLMLLALVLVSMTNPLTMGLSLGGAGLAALYPFMKRYTYFPQLVLGAAFSWGMPMAFAAESNRLDAVVWYLFLANLSWTFAYDTIYAMVDREDDLNIGVKSTAVFFGRFDLLAVSISLLISLAFLIIAGITQHLGIAYWLGTAFGTAFCAYLVWGCRQRQPNRCFQSFRRMHWVGFCIWLGISTHYALNS